MFERAIAAMALATAGAGMATTADAGSATTTAVPKTPSAVQNGPYGQWYTTQDNCTYSRTQAPGYPPQWYLVLNPHHLGKPDAHAGCPTRIEGTITG